MAMSPLRAMFVTGSLTHGGAERHSITLMNRLAERGHECHAVYVKDDASQLGRLRLGSAGTAFCLVAPRYLDPAALARFAAHIGRLRPSVLVAANAYALMYASLARRLSGLELPLVVTYHSTRLVGIKEHIKMLADRFFFLAADCLVFVCDAQRRYWRRRGVFARQNKVIHNGVDFAHYDPAEHALAGRQVRAAAGFADGDFVIGMLALLRPEKNPQQLLAAVAALRAQGIPARALFIGDGPLRPDVEAAAKRLDIAGFVSITGLQEDVRPSLAACDVVVLCSSTEALSLAALEAMAMGRPVVHSDVGGASELIASEENGLLFPAGDTPALVAALARLADRQLALRMGDAARSTVAATFSEEVMVDRYEHTLLALCTAQAATGRGAETGIGVGTETGTATGIGTNAGNDFGKRSQQT
jgi:glycosyltransferase involved in cell wall biosynthesis